MLFQKVQEQKCPFLAATVFLWSELCTILLFNSVTREIPCDHVNVLNIVT